MHKHRILIVDDSPSELRILMETLKHKYAIVVATSGTQAIQMIKEDSAIELVLLDVMMPDVNGYDVCKEVLKISPQLPIVFVSSNDSTEEILTGFDVGGSDYLTKPIDTNVVSRKVEVILQERAKLVELQCQNQDTSDMVMSVIASAGHLGTVLGFLRAGLKIKSHEGLISALFDVFDSLNIDACVQLRTHAEPINQATNGTLTPLELDLLTRSVDMKSRFLERGTRYIVKFDSVSVIIKNMPVNDDMALGELRDNLMMILEDTNALNQKLIESQFSHVQPERANDAKNGKQAAVDLFNDMLASLHVASEINEKFEEQILNFIEDMAIEFEQCFFKLELLDDQEQALMSLLEKQAKALTNNLDKSAELRSILKSLHKLIDNHKD